MSAPLPCFSVQGCCVLHNNDILLDCCSAGWLYIFQMQPPSSNTVHTLDTLQGCCRQFNWFVQANYSNQIILNWIIWKMYFHSVWVSFSKLSGLHCPCSQSKLPLKVATTLTYHLWQLWWKRYNMRLAEIPLISVRLSFWLDRNTKQTKKTKTTTKNLQLLCFSFSVWICQ